MKAQDLRIGNLVKTPRGIKSINGLGFKDTVVSSKDYYATFNNLHEGYFLDHCEPIPLTEEILLKCGFEFVRNNDEPFYQLIKNGIVFNSDYLSVEDSIDCAFNIGNNLLKFKYLHQLQNIFFTLTNEELTINLLTKNK
ncbi:hypothetical protein [Flavobacterium sp.]|jgi:hypothetical protein|uniref:hypothetical protein n=1 Tax=Flavobacterium sp. TaxID=239 RepID=UPI0037BEBB02